MKSISRMGFMLLSATAVSTGSAQQGYLVERVARIEYGTQDGQVGVFWGEEGADVESVKGLAVDTEGNIYLGDRVNSKIKKFGKNGQLLAVTEGRVYDVSAFSVDSKGNILF